MMSLVVVMYILQEDKNMDAALKVGRWREAQILSQNSSFLCQTLTLDFILKVSYLFIYFSWTYLDLILSRFQRRIKVLLACVLSLGVKTCMYVCMYV